MSYKCPKNALGSREPPAKKKRNEKDEHCEAETEVPDNDDSGLDTLGAAIHYEVHFLILHFKSLTVINFVLYCSKN